MLISFFTASGLLFWVLIAAFVFAETALTEAENLGMAVFLAVALAVVLALFSDITPLGWMQQHIILTVAMVPIYFVVGALWSLWKWSFLVQASVEDFESRKAELRKDKDERWQKTEWSEFLRDRGFPPSPAKNKERITTWIAFWPFSALWAVMTYPRKLAIAIYKRLLAVFDRMASAAFAGKLN